MEVHCHVHKSPYLVRGNVRVRVLSPLQTQSWRTIHCRLSIHNTRSYPPHLDGVWSTRNLRTLNAGGDKKPLHTTLSIYISERFLTQSWQGLADILHYITRSFRLFYITFTNNLSKWMNVYDVIVSPVNTNPSLTTRPNLPNKPEYRVGCSCFHTRSGWVLSNILFRFKR
jgi:hypothetical protein